MNYSTPTPDGVSSLIISTLHMRAGRPTKRKWLAQGHAAKTGKAGTPCLLLFCSTIQSDCNLAPKPKINEQMHVTVRHNFTVFCICLLINKWRTGAALSFSLSVNYSSDFHVSKRPWIFSYYHYLIRNYAPVSIMLEWCLSSVCMCKRMIRVSCPKNTLKQEK